jgi:putative phosphoesterase
MPMRFAIVSDIHGNLPALQAVVADFTRRGVCHAVNLGDSLSGPLMPLETAQFLMKQDWVHLAGNHDREVRENGPGSVAADHFARAQLGTAEIAWLATLPPRWQYAPDVLLCHGTPNSDLIPLLQTADHSATSAEVEKRLGDAQAILIACGHTHVPRIVKSRNGTLIVNPGSVGQPAYADDHPYPYLVENGSPDARYAIVEKHDGHWQAQLIAVSYEHNTMAALAKANGREDWARALATGYLS